MESSPNLKSLWWLYVLGLFAFAYWPARIGLASIQHPAALLEMTAALAVGISALEIVGRRRAGRWRGQSQDEPEDELFRISVLDLSFPARRTSERSTTFNAAHAEIAENL